MQHFLIPLFCSISTSKHFFCIASDFFEFYRKISYKPQRYIKLHCAQYVAIKILTSVETLDPEKTFF